MFKSKKTKFACLLVTSGTSTWSEESMGSVPARLDFSLSDVPRRPIPETSEHSSTSSVDVLDQTSSTAIRDTDVQFINDTIALGAKRLTCPAPRRVRTHHVNVTIPTDKTNTRPDMKAVVANTRHNSNSTEVHTQSVRRNSASTRPHTESTVTNMRHDSTNARPRTKTAVTFENVEQANIEPSASSVAGFTNSSVSAVDANQRQNINVLSSVDRGELFSV